jgi:hypothetical protein
LLDIIAAALRVGVHPNTLRRAAWKGDLAHQRNSGKILFRPEDIDAFAAGRNESQAAFDLQREVRRLRDGLKRLAEKLERGSSPRRRRSRSGGSSEMD